MRGFGLQALEVEQGIEVLAIIVSIYTLRLSTSKLLKQTIEYVQLKEGINYLIFSANFKTYRGLAIEGWIKSVWQFIDYYNLSLTLPNSHYPTSAILNDRTIMSVAIEYQLFNRKLIQIINIIQLSLYHI